MADHSPRPILRYLEASPEVEARFWEKVARRGPDECWPWTASLNTSGYGRFKLASYETRHANRVAWVAFNRREPGDLIVRHSCDNPQCCNPAHLLIGTHQDNMDDKLARGRNRTGDQRGVKNPRARLTVEQVGEIVTEFRSGYQNNQIARRKPVGHALISRIRTGRSWQREAAQFGWQPAIEFLASRGAEIARLNRRDVA